MSCTRGDAEGWLFMVGDLLSTTSRYQRHSESSVTNVTKGGLVIKVTANTSLRTEDPVHARQKMHRTILIAIFLISSQVTLLCQAQTAPATLKIGSVDFSGNIRVRMEAWDFFPTTAADGTYAFGASTIRLAIGQKKKAFDWQVEIEQPTLLGLPDDAVAPAPQGQLGLGATYFASNHDSNTASIFLKQGFIRLKGLGNEFNSLRLGRFEFLDGSETVPRDPVLAALKRDRISQRLIGNFGFSHIGRSLDGAQLVLGGNPSNFTFMAGRTTKGVFNVQGMPELDVDLEYGAYTHATGGRNASELRVFGLGYHDGRNYLLKTDNRSAADRKKDGENIRVATFGGNFLQTFPVLNRKGTWDLLGWGAGQFGAWGRLDHRAWAYAAEVGYQHKITHFNPWLRAGYNASSGDSNPKDGTHGTFFQNLPTPRVYARSPFYNLMNNQDLFVEFITRPHAKVTTRFDVHDLHLSSSKDLWYSGGGAFEDSSFGYTGRPSNNVRHLATVYDIGADVQLTKRAGIGLYYARIAGGDVIQKIYPKGSNANFGYLEWTFKF
jgi:hypothetical protein